jgi:hypothetical protein
MTPETLNTKFLQVDTAASKISAQAGVKKGLAMWGVAGILNVVVPLIWLHGGIYAACTVASAPYMPARELGYPMVCPRFPPDPSRTPQNTWFQSNCAVLKHMSDFSIASHDCENLSPQSVRVLAVAGAILGQFCAGPMGSIAGIMWLFDFRWWRVLLAVVVG